MKAFWALIAVLVLGSVALLASGLLSGKKSGGADKQLVAPSQATQPVVAQRDEVAKAPSAPPVAAAAPQPTPVKTADPVATEKPAVVAVQPAAEPVQEAAKPASEEPAKVDPPKADATKSSEPSKTVEAPKSAPEATKPEEPVNQLVELRKEIEAQRAAEAAKKEAAKTAPPAPAAAAPAEGAEGPFAGAKVETNADGSMLIDGKYTVKGKGTESDPYKVTWDQLVSAQNEYAPKEGRKTIPARIKALDDKWLEITGYVAFPLMSNETDELLSMMNQWDGCCIGIPPTPYDAIEVRLTSAISGNARLTTYGSIKGKFKVDPHLVGGWLVGLYVMDQAKLTPVSYGGIAP